MNALLTLGLMAAVAAFGVCRASFFHDVGRVASRCVAEDCDESPPRSEAEAKDIAPGLDLVRLGDTPRASRALLADDLIVEGSGLITPARSDALRCHSHVMDRWLWSRHVRG